MPLSSKIIFLFILFGAGILSNLMRLGFAPVSRMKVNLAPLFKLINSILGDLLILFKLIKHFSTVGSRNWFPGA